MEKRLFDRGKDIYLKAFDTCSWGVSLHRELILFSFEAVFQLNQRHERSTVKQQQRKVVNPQKHKLEQGTCWKTKNRKAILLESLADRWNRATVARISGDRYKEAINSQNWINYDLFIFSVHKKILLFFNKMSPDNIPNEPNHDVIKLLPLRLWLGGSLSWWFGVIVIGESLLTSVWIVLCGGFSVIGWGSIVLFIVVVLLVISWFLSLLILGLNDFLNYFCFLMISKVAVDIVLIHLA